LKIRACRSDLFSASPGAIAAGLKAFKDGNQVVVADTNMIVSGVNKGLLSAYGSKVECLVAEEETRREALAAGVTRSMINIRRAAEKFPGAIYAIGNAPTALYELLQLIEEGRVHPALVVGVPVGFVEAEESKEALLQSGVPHIVIRGRKGGSTVAVAIINAILKLAGKDRYGGAQNAARLQHRVVRGCRGPGGHGNALQRSGSRPSDY